MIFHIDSLCEDCSEPPLYECQLCLRDVNNGCECWSDPDIDELEFYCSQCERVYSIDVDEYLSGEEYEYSCWDSYTDYYDWRSEAGRVFAFASPTTDEKEIKEKVKVITCRHESFELRFPDGTIVYPSSMIDRKHGEDEIPDFGLYLDSGWKPMSMCFYLKWPDYGLPKSYSAAFETIVETYKLAQRGLWVEVSCIGGHGRTGTVLACMAILAGVPGDKAVDWVKTNYCTKAVETEEQQWLVRLFDAWINGGESPPFPDKKDPFTITYDYGFEWKEFDPFATPKGRPSDKKRKQTYMIEYEVEKVKDKELTASISLDKISYDEPW